jgi:6-phosphogluconolactonase
MRYTSSLRRRARLLFAALPFLICAAEAFGADTYDSSNHRLSIPTVAIGNATYSNMVVTVGGIVGGPTGTSANGSEDSYDPVNNQLTIQSVVVGSITYHNVIVTVAALNSVGGVIGADTFDGVNLTIPEVRLGGTVYTHVVVTVGSIISTGGGMPTAGWDKYDPASTQLTIAAIQLGSKVYTNPIITVQKVVSGGATGYTGYAFVASEANSQIAQFDVGIKGQLSPLAIPTLSIKGSNPLSITADSTGRYVYVANANAGIIFQYGIGAGGALVPLRPASISTPLTATYIVANPRGPYLYATAGAAGIYQFNIGADGTLTPMSTASVGGADVEYAISMDPQGKYLLVAGTDRFTGTNINLVYPIGSNGAAATPTLYPNTLQGTAMAIDPTEAYAYQATTGGVSIYGVYGGLLTELAGSVTTPGNSAPWAAAVDPSGRYVYVTGSALSQFTIASGGQLQPMTPAAVTAGTGPTGIAFDPTGKFAYVSNMDGTVSQFGIGPTGGLSPLNPSVVFGIGAAEALIVVPIQPN